MNELPTIADQRPKRSKALRLALAFGIGMTVSTYAASMGRELRTSFSKYTISIRTGAIIFMSITEPDYFREICWYYFSRRQDPWSLKRPGYEEAPYMSGKIRAVIIPFWLPLLPLLAFAALLIYRDRTRRPPGHCRK